MRPTFFLFISLLLLALACKRKEATTWDVHGRAPLAQGTILWNDLVPDSLTNVDDQGKVHFILERSLIDFELDTLVRLEDTTIHKEFTLPFSGGPFPYAQGANLTNLIENMLLGLSNAEIQLIEVQSGTLIYEMQSSVDGELDITYDLPGVILPDGTPLQLTAVTEPASLAEPWVFEGSQDLANTSIDLRGISNSSHNRLATELNVDVLATAAEQAQIFGEDSVLIDITFQDVIISYGRGYFGNRVEETTSQVDISPFLETVGYLELPEIELQLELINPVGVDASFTIEEIKAVRGMEELNLTHSLINQQVNITRALDEGGFVQANTYAFLIDETNSNIADVIGMIPEYLEISTDLEINPLGDISGGNDFIYTEELIEANMRFDLPMTFYTSGLTLIDTLSIAPFETDINATTDLIFNIQNHFPVALSNIQAEFVTYNGERVQLLEDMSIASAAYVNIGTTIPASSEHVQSLPPEVFTVMQEGGYVQLSVTLDVLDGVPVSISGNESIDVSILVDGDFELKYE